MLGLLPGKTCECGAFRRCDTFNYHRTIEWPGLEGTSRITKLQPPPPPAGPPTATCNTSPGCPGPPPTCPSTPPRMDGASTASLGSCSSTSPLSLPTTSPYIQSKRRLPRIPRALQGYNHAAPQLPCMEHCTSLPRPRCCIARDRR